MQEKPVEPNDPTNPDNPNDYEDKTEPVNPNKPSKPSDNNKPNKPSSSKLPQTGAVVGSSYNYYWWCSNCWIRNSIIKKKKEII